MSENLQKLRDDLDRIDAARWAVWHTYGKTRPVLPVERVKDAERHRGCELAQAELDYECALMGAAWPAVNKIANGRHIPDKAEVFVLRRDQEVKWQRYYELDKCGIEFCKTSELIEAKVAWKMAWFAYDAALEKNGAKNLAGCRPPKRRAVIEDADGKQFAKTGKYVWIDGERLPELEPVS